MDKKALILLTALLAAAIMLSGCQAPPALKCGNGVCEADETSLDCQKDCQYCNTHDECPLESCIGKIVRCIDNTCREMGECDECITAEDCEGKAHPAVIGYWKCSTGKCAWVQTVFGGLEKACTETELKQWVFDYPGTEEQLVAEARDHCFNTIVQDNMGCIASETHSSFLVKPAYQRVYIECNTMCPDETPGSEVFAVFYAYTTAPGFRVIEYISPYSQTMQARCEAGWQ